MSPQKDGARALSRHRANFVSSVSPAYSAVPVPTLQPRQATVPLSARFQLPTTPYTKGCLLQEGQQSKRKGALACKGAADTRQSPNVTQSNRESPSEHDERLPRSDHALGCSRASFFCRGVRKPWLIWQTQPHHLPFKAASLDKMKLLRASAEAEAKLAVAMGKGQGTCPNSAAQTPARIRTVALRRLRSDSDA